MTKTPSVLLDDAEAIATILKLRNAIADPDRWS
jgi:hypothetical protein